MPTGCSNPGALGASDPRTVARWGDSAVRAWRPAASADHHACDQHGWALLQVALQPDHVRLCLPASPTLSAADVVKQIKGYTAHELRAAFPTLRTMPSLWIRSYVASTAGKVSSSTIRAYIETQKGRVAMRKTFQYRLYP